LAAINKRKLLDSAQRNLQKGALDKALKDYQIILEADPRDANVRLKMGDLQLKAGKNDDAITAYLKVADQFMRDGFDAKAVAIYKQITKIDTKRHDIYAPLADLYQRLGLVSEAMGALQTAADSFHREGRKREALELLRRMASLDPSNVTSRLKVAQLLQQEGLADEALAEYREAAAELDRQGDWEARVGVLQRILELRADDVDALATLAELLVDHQQAKQAQPIARRLVEADGDRPESHEVLARILTDLGQPAAAVEAHRQAAEAWRRRGDEDRARAIVQRFIPAEPFAPDSAPDPTIGTGESPFGAEGLGSEPFTVQGDEFGRSASQVLEDDDAEPATLPEPPPLPPRAAPTQPELPPKPKPAKAPAPKPTAAPAAKPQPAKPAAPPAVKPTPAPTAKPGAPVAPPAAAAKPAARPAAAPTAQSGVGDVDQLLAEAGVYLRYGKHERALASLETVLARAPEHPLALEQLGEALAGTGENDRAVASWTKAAELARAAGQAERLDALIQRIAAIDADAAAEIAPLPAEEPEPNEGDAGEVDAASLDADALADIEIDVDPSHFEDDAAEEPDDSLEEDALDEEDAESGDAPEEIPDELEEGDSLEAADTEEASEPEADELELPDSLDEIVEEEEEVVSPPDAWELPPDEDELAAGDAESAAGEEEAEAGDEPSEPPARSTPPGELSSTTTQQILEEFEEAGFYFEQRLFAEAEAIYQRILQRAPSHPGALLRLGEIAVERGRDPGDGVAAPEDATDSTERAPEAEAMAPPPTDDDSLDIAPPDESDLTSRDLQAVGDAAWLGETGKTRKPDGEPTEAPTPAAPAAAASAPAAKPEPPAAKPQPAVATRPEPARAAVAPPAPAPVAAAASAQGESELTTPEVAQEGDPNGAAFDLAAELSEALASPERPRAAAEEDGFDAVFREFKRGVSQTLGEGDAETHFDLGIAYREMGLLEDAIGEFRYALGMPARRLDALHMMGLCALDLGRPQDAVGHFEQALASPEVPAPREAPLRFDLGRAYQALGDRDRALGALRRVAELEPDFQDVAQRIAALEAGEPTESAGEPTADAEAYESFDDLIADSSEEEAEEAAPARESYESFDDVVADDDEASEAPPAAEPPAAEPAPEAEAEAELVDSAPELPQPEPREPSPTARRRRKVSFV